MKKLLAVLVLLAALLSLAGCGDAVTIGPLSSRYFDSEDYDSAVQEVLTFFQGFEGCTMKKIGYAGDAAVKAEAEARGLAPEQIIVLTSTFETDGTSREDGLEPNKSYEDYQWILTRGGSFDPFWEIVEQG